MGKNIITDEDKDYYKEKIFILLKDGKKHSQNDIAKSLNIACSQARGLIGEIRKDVKRGKYPITAFIVADRHGYYMPTANTDYLTFYKNMYTWATTMLIRIKPINDYLSSEGIDMTAIRKELKERSLSSNYDPVQMDEKDHWRQ